MVPSSFVSYQSPKLLVVVSLPQLTSQLPAISLIVLGKTISPVLVATDFGLYLDQCVNYSIHITKTSSTCSHPLVQVNRIKHLLDRKSLMLLVNSFVFSKLVYCSFV